MCVFACSCVRREPLSLRGESNVGDGKFLSDAKTSALAVCCDPTQSGDLNGKHGDSGTAEDMNECASLEVLSYSPTLHGATLKSETRDITIRLLNSTF